jgi:hypothetical protein
VPELGIPNQHYSDKAGGNRFELLKPSTPLEVAVPDYESENGFLSGGLYVRKSRLTLRHVHELIDSGRSPE